MTRRSPFAEDPEKAREAGRKGGIVGGIKSTKPPAPYAGTIADLMDLCGLVGEDWAAWRAILKAAFALPLTPEELETFRRLTGREIPPTRQVSELWFCVGRRGGKSTIAALVALYQAIRFDPRSYAKEGELVTVPMIAPKRDQVRVLLGHLRSFCRVPELRQYVARSDLKETVVLKNGITIEISTASSAGVRGYTSPCAVADEVAHWADEGSSDPAEEILSAVKPTMGTVPNAMLLALSNPHAPRGPLFDAVETFYGKPDDDVLVVVADTLSLHPSFNPAVIKRAYTMDAVRASAEYGSAGTIQFRQHQQALLDREPLDAAIVGGRYELPPVQGVRYFAWIDAAQGGRSGDSFSLSIAHNESGIAVQDLLIGRDPPFNPLALLVDEFIPALKRYNIRAAVGDHVSSGFVEATLRAHGLRFEAAAKSKSDLYLQVLNLINSGAAQLLDHAGQRLQFLSLQRFATGGGRDRIDHPRGKQAHDDLCNSGAGALVLASGVTGKPAPRAMWRMSGANMGHASSGAEERQRSQSEVLQALAARTIRRLEAEDRANDALSEVTGSLAWDALVKKINPHAGEFRWHTQDND